MYFYYNKKKKMLLSKFRDFYKITFSKKKTGGRNNRGRITVAHKGGGHKRLYRPISNQVSSPGFIFKMIYNPNRTAHNAGLTTKGQLITCPQNLKIFDIVNNHENIYYDKNWISDENVKQVGSTYPIEFFNVGDYIHNIRIHSLLKNNNSSIKKNQINSWLVRSAGSFAEILEKTSDGVIIRLPSGEHRKIVSNSLASFGAVSNENHFNVSIKKAGRSRWLNKRPTVRGVAMNPIDHPHGGNTSGGRYHLTPWSRLTKGVPTRSLKKKNKMIIKRYNKK